MFLLFDQESILIFFSKNFVRPSLVMLIKNFLQFFTLIRLVFWLFVLITYRLTHTFFIVETWNFSLLFVWTLTVISTLISLNVFKRSSWLWIIYLFSITLICSTIYLIYIRTISYRIMNLLTINIMINDQDQTWLSDTLNFYRCCRVRDEPIFDSVDERDYFLQFSYCQTKEDRWSSLRSCVDLFQLIRLYTRSILLIDIVLLIAICFMTFNVKRKQNDSFVYLTVDHNRKIH